MRRRISSASVTVSRHRNATEEGFLLGAGGGGDRLEGKGGCLPLSDLLRWRRSFKNPHLRQLLEEEEDAEDAVEEDDDDREADGATSPAAGSPELAAGAGDDDGESQWVRNGERERERR